jgi:hypothetical protein
VTSPQHYQMQFSTGEEHVQLIERARALLARERPGATLGELHFEAMKMFVATLEKRKFAVTDRPRKPSAQAATHAGRNSAEPPRQRVDLDEREPPEVPHQGVVRDAREPQRRRDDIEADEPPLAAGRRVALDAPEPGEALRQRADLDQRGPAAAPRQRGRYIPAAERRAVFQRDCGRCSYVDARGERCSETHYLELHHLQPFARHGANIASNLTLRCRAHNALAAEQDFGPELMASKRDSSRHESFAAQVDAKQKC